MSNREVVAICYPAVRKITAADISEYEYNSPISASQLKAQYDNMISVLVQNNIRIIKIPASTLDSVFIQDPFIETPTHSIISRFRNKLRTSEPENISKLLRKPIYIVKRGFLEGGDYLYNRGITFIMAGQRTSKQAIRDLMYADVFGTSKIARITSDQQCTNRCTSDPTKIHLDCMLGFIDNVAVIWSGAKSFLVDVYERTGKQIASIPLLNYLENLGYKIFEITDEEQRTYSCNFVCFDTFVLAQNPRLVNATKKRVIIVDMSELNKMRGGIHCAIKKL
jgi:N-dimethylarginine dimethylaminohydrolase